MIVRVMDSMLDDPALAMYRLVGRPDELAREGLFAVEGRLVLPRLLASRYRVHSVLVSEAARGALSPLLDEHPDVKVLVSNPDNIGGIFRSAHAFGAAAVLLGPGCGDPLYRKAIRTSMGATLDVPWGVLADWPGDLRELEARGFTLVALTPDASARALREVVAESAKPIALLLGSEGFGLTSGPMALACAARIPMPNGSADSLNVAAAASIALYEASH